MREQEENQSIAALVGRPARQAASGFTLLEVMIVLALLGLIAGSIGVAVFNSFRKGQVNTAKLQVKEVSNAVMQYMIENNSECPKGIEDMVAKKNLTKPPKDPWGSEFILRCPGQNDTDGADVVSVGKDKQEGTADDIKSWE